MPTHLMRSCTAPHISDKVTPTYSSEILYNLDKYPTRHSMYSTDVNYTSTILTQGRTVQFQICFLVLQSEQFFPPQPISLRESRSLIVKIKLHRQKNGGPKVSRK